MLYFAQPNEKTMYQIKHILVPVYNEPDGEICGGEVIELTYSIRKMLLKQDEVTLFDISGNVNCHTDDLRDCISRTFPDCEIEWPTEPKFI